MHGCGTITKFVPLKRKEEEQDCGMLAATKKKDANGEYDSRGTEVTGNFPFAAKMFLTMTAESVSLLHTKTESAPQFI